MKQFLLQRIRSFGYAFKGIIYLFQSETHAKIHLISLVLISMLGYLLQISTIEWCVLLLCFALVLGMEATNTALERLTDLVSPDYHPLAGKAKDLAAAAVLLTIILVIIVGIIIFLPKIYIIIGNVWEVKI